MKTLKLDHRLAQLVAEGKQTSTWRLYDDKDLSVNDVVRLVDKVDPKRPETWHPIGTAHVNTIIQKRLGDIEHSDYEGQEQFASTQDMLKAYQSYYGQHVTMDTPVKIIHFTFYNSIDDEPLQDGQSGAILTEVKLYADGGSRGNPGPSASGFVLLDMDNKVVVKSSMYLGVTTNNQAEYQALKLGLEEAQRMRAKKVHVYMDSLLVVNQMVGTFKIKNRDLWPVHDAVKELAGSFEQVSFTHVPRELNKVADAAVNEALDAELEGKA